MQVLSEAVPMTDGEVYALLRRRRDERNAARHPPFGLQPPVSDGHAIPATQPRAPPAAALTARDGTVPVSSAASAVSGVAGGGGGSGYAGRGTPSPAGMHSSTNSNLSGLHHSSGVGANGRAVAADALMDSAAVAAASTNAHLFSGPSSGHLIVLLTEVTVLNYLANHAALAAEERADADATADASAAHDSADAADAGKHTIRSVYGPTSVYDRGVAAAAAAFSATGVTDASASPSHANAAGSDGADTLPGLSAAAAGAVSDAFLDATQVEASYAALSRHRPGTAGHVKAVADLLEQYDEAGKAQERVYAAGIRRVVQQLWQRRLWSPAGHDGFTAATPSAALALKNDHGMGVDQPSNAAVVKTETAAVEESEESACAGGGKKGSEREQAAEMTRGQRRGESNKNSTEQQQQQPTHTAAPSLADHERLTPAATHVGDVVERPSATAEGDAAASTRKKQQNEEAMAAAAAAAVCGDAAARPSVPLLMEPTPLLGPSAATHAGAGVYGASSTIPLLSALSTSTSSRQLAHGGRSLLTEAEVLRLVSSRPRRPLDVYRLLDDIDSRLQYNEEAIAAFVEGVTAVFNT